MFSDSTDLDSSVLAQGEGQIQFEIPVEAMSVSFRQCKFEIQPPDSSVLAQVTRSAFRLDEFRASSVNCIWLVVHTL